MATLETANVMQCRDVCVREGMSESVCVYVLATCVLLLCVVAHFSAAVHFFYAYLQVVPACDSPATFVIPTGAAGHVTAAMMAKLCGLPIGKLVAATNENGNARRPCFLTAVSSCRFVPFHSVPLDVVPHLVWPVPTSVCLPLRV